MDKTVELNDNTVVVGLVVFVLAWFLFFFSSG